MDFNNYSNDVLNNLKFRMLLKFCARLGRTFIIIVIAAFVLFVNNQFYFTLERITRKIVGGAGYGCKHVWVRGRSPGRFTFDPGPPLLIFMANLPKQHRSVCELLFLLFFELACRCCYPQNISLDR